MHENPGASAYRVTVVAHQEVWVIVRREAMPYQCRDNFCACLHTPAQQKIPLIGTLCARVECTEKSESSGEKTHALGVLVSVAAERPQPTKGIYTRTPRESERSGWNCLRVMQQRTMREALQAYMSST